MEVLHQPEEIIAQRYRILGTLGQGGVGITYAAQDLQNERRVAVKALSLRRMTDWKKIELFEREARILSQLNHPAIPRYLDYFQVDTEGDRRFYIVQQIAEGKSLATLIEKGWHPDEARVRNLTIQVLKILIYLHDLTPPVIHRDIKPQNIIVQQNGRIFLVDFGAVQDTFHNTVTGSTIVGTYGYMAPEQFRGQAVPSTDLYGLGTTLLFLLTGQSPSDLPQHQLKIDFRSQIRVSKDFADWLEKTIEPVIEDRFSSAKEALAVLQGEQVLPKSSFQRLSQPEDSPISLRRTGKRLVIEIPPVGLRTKSSQNLALINLICNGLLAFTVWLLVDLSLFIQPSNLLAFGVYGLFCLWILTKFLYGTLSRTKLEIDSSTLRLQKWLLGSLYQNSYGCTPDIYAAKLGGVSLPLKIKSFTFCVLRSKRLNYEFGGFLTQAEKEWLMEEISIFLERVRS